MTRGLTAFLLGIFCGLAVVGLLAQPGTNNAVYGRDGNASAWTFLATPTSANLAAAITDEQGSGALMFSQQVPTAVASLPTCDGGINGSIRIVNNALVPVIGSVIAGGGGLIAGVICVNGSGWVKL